jgi:hypothetical protein
VENSVIESMHKKNLHISKIKRLFFVIHQCLAKCGDCIYEKYYACQKQWCQACMTVSSWDCLHSFDYMLFILWHVF